MRNFLTFFLTLWVSLMSLQAQDYYWVGGANNNDYDSLRNWATSPGGAPGVGILQAPQSFNDIYFDNNYAWAANERVILNNPAFCRNMIWTATQTNIGFRGSATMSTYGTVQLMPNMSFSTITTSPQWNGIWRLYGAGTQTFEGANVLLRNTAIRFEPLTATGNYTISNIRHVSGAGALTIFNSPSIVPIPTYTFTNTTQLADLVVNGGIVNFNSPVAGTGGAANSYTQTGGRVDFNAATTISSSSIQIGLTRVNGNAHVWGALGTNNGAAACTFEIPSATITIGSSWRVLNPNLTFNSANSTIFYNGNGVLNPGGTNKIYNNFICNAWPPMEGLGTFDTLIFRRGFYSQGGAAANYTIGVGTAGLLRLENGETYPVVMPYVAVVHTFNVGGTVTTQLQGTCRFPLYLKSIDFNFAAGAGVNIQAQNMRLENVRALGVDAPYNAGAGSIAVPFTTNTNWQVAGVSVDAMPVPAGRYLRWVGAIPSNLTDSTLYGLWTNPANWANGNTNPLVVPIAGLSPFGGECPPTLLDSVVFPDNSYVRLDTILHSCKTMMWLGAGNMADYNNVASSPSGSRRILEIGGSLHFATSSLPSTSMRNRFRGTTHFRAWEPHPTILSSAQPIHFLAMFEGLHDSTRWTLLDSASVSPVVLPNIMHTLQLKRGELNTNEKNIRTHSLWSATTRYRHLNIQKSQIYVYGTWVNYIFNAASTSEGQVWVNDRGNGLFVSADNSHIHVLDSSANATATSGNSSRMRTGGGHAWFDITFYGQYHMLFHSSTSANSSNRYNIVTFQGGGRFPTQNSPTTVVVHDSVRILRTHQRWQSGIPVGNFWLDDFNVNNTASGMWIDSAFFKGNALFDRDINYGSRLHLYPGNSYTINEAFNAATPTRIQRLLSANALNAQGTCTNPIYITGGRFASTFAQSADYLVLTDNNAATATFSHTNSTLNGNTTGWTGGTQAARTLYWLDQAPGNTVGNWSNPSFWSLADGVMLDMLGGNDPLVGNCPPTRIDDVFFTNNSFNSAFDTVRIAMNPLSAECRNMMWTVANPALSPVFRGTATTIALGNTSENLNIYGSLEFSARMQQQFNHNIGFLATTLGNTVRMNTRQFNRRITFQGTGGEWILQDSLSAPITADGVQTIRLLSGTLNTNNQSVNTQWFLGGSTLPIQTRLTLGTSQIYIIGGGTTVWNTNFNGITVSAASSHIRFTNATNTMSLFNGQIYNDITSSNNTAIIGTNNRFNNVTFLGTGGSINNAGGFVRRLEQTTPTGNFIFAYATLTPAATPGLRVDSCILSGFATFNGNNRFDKLLKMTPAKTYTFQSGSVQWLSNAADLQGSGTGGGGEIIWNATATNQKAHIRKDSGRVCIDFIYMRDVWAIGNGLSTQTACASPLCDTSDLSWQLPTLVTSGRARFQAGANADNQGNNAGWDFTPYPPFPKMRLTNVDIPFKCMKDSVIMVFEVEGQLPISGQYSYK